MCTSATLALMALFAVSVVWLVDQLRRRRDLQVLANDIGHFFDEHDVAR
jgi:hypothetical protein